ncbi:MAG: response regulator transcription factor [Oscillospiraceae bacterium]|nr:response regulator transcription factor [Oscillospiraceae bacterium]
MTANDGKLILLVEDNRQIMDGNMRMLQREGYEIVCALTLSEAHAIMLSGRRPDLIVLDIMMPDGSGLDFMRELRERNHSGVPILLLTGLSTKEDVLRGLTAGGDDYLTKPYDFDELLARIEALLRRSLRVPEFITKGRLSLDVTAGMASLDGIDLLLTQKEFALLLIFVQNEDRHIGGEYLYEKIWKAPMANDNQAVKKTIYRLRLKIKDSEWSINWTRGEGYCFERD